MPEDSSHHDPAGKHPALESTPAGAQTSNPLGGDSPQRGREHGFREGARSGGEDSRDTRPDRATRFVETSLGILSYSQLAPLLSDRVTALEAEVLKGGFATDPLDESLVLKFHHRIAGDLVPDWAGRWRDIAVRVGRLEPPPPFQVPVLMRDYCRDLQARWTDAQSDQDTLLLEFLAFAEGRFLTIHPFRDFNGRTIRVLLLEILNRLDLPRVQLAPQSHSSREEYFSALEAADHCDWQPLVSIWHRRLTADAEFQ
jgi:CRISPR-associated endonuclease/helicase Cas3